MQAAVSADLRRPRLTNVHRVLLVAALNLALLLLCAAVFSPTPENNDDYIVQTVLAGAFGELSPYIGIVNVFLARGICALQNAAPALNWFAVLLYAFLCAGLCAVGSALWLARPDAVGGLMSGAFCVFVGAPLYLSLQYTKFAIFIAAAGCLSLLFGLYARPRPLAAAVGALLCVFAAMVRMEAFAAGAALCLPPVLFVLLRKRAGGLRGWLRANARALLCFAGVLAAVLALGVAHRAVYAAHPEAEHYRRYLAAQQRVTDYTLAPYDERWAEYDALGMSENDLQMIADWSFADGEKFTAETLSAVAQAGAGGSDSVLARFLQGLSLFTLTKSSAWFCAAVWLLALLLGDGATRLKASAALAAYPLLLLALAAAGRVTRWVCMGMLAACCATMAWSLVSGHIRVQKRVALGLCGGLCALCVAFTAATLPWGQARRNAEDILQVYADLASNGETLYLADMSSMPALFERLSVFVSAPRGLYANVYELGGWNTETPAKNQVLERFGVSGSPYRALISRADVFLIDTAHFETKVKYLRENYSRTACWSLYDNIDGLFVYAASETPVFVPDEETVLVECAAEPAAYDPAWVTYNAVVQTERTAEAAYLSFEREGEPAMTYRARILKTQDGAVYLSCTVPPLDLPDLGGRAMRVILRTKSGAVGCATAEDISKEAEENDR